MKLKMMFPLLLAGEPAARATTSDICAYLLYGNDEWCKMITTLPSGALK